MTSKQQIKFILAASLAVSLAPYPIIYNGSLLDDPRPKNGTLPNTCKWAIDSEILWLDCRSEAWK
jgi:hypothetical protein